MSTDGLRPDAALAAQVIDLSQIGAAQLADLLDSELYLLGVNGPLGPDDIGHIDRFVWRFALLRQPGRPPALLAFSAMPRLMAFTRVLNSAIPFAVPTEARRQRLGSAAAGIPFLLLVDPDPEACASVSRGSATAERVIPELDR